MFIWFNLVAIKFADVGGALINRSRSKITGVVVYTVNIVNDKSNEHVVVFSSPHKARAQDALSLVAAQIKAAEENIDGDGASLTEDEAVAKWSELRSRSGHLSDNDATVDDDAHQAEVRRSNLSELAIEMASSAMCDAPLVEIGDFGLFAEPKNIVACWAHETAKRGGVVLCQISGVASPVVIASCADIIEARNVCNRVADLHNRITVDQDLANRLYQADRFWQQPPGDRSPFASNLAKTRQTRRVRMLQLRSDPSVVCAEGSIDPSDREKYIAVTRDVEIRDDGRPEGFVATENGRVDHSVYGAAVEDVDEDADVDDKDVADAFEVDTPCHERAPLYRMSKTEIANNQRMPHSVDGKSALNPLESVMTETAEHSKLSEPDGVQREILDRRIDTDDISEATSYSVDA